MWRIRRAPAWTMFSDIGTLTWNVGGSINTYQVAGARSRWRPNGCGFAIDGGSNGSTMPDGIYHFTFECAHDIVDLHGRLCLDRTR